MLCFACLLLGVVLLAGAAAVPWPAAWRRVAGMVEVQAFGGYVAAAVQVLQLVHWGGQVQRWQYARLA
jgi:hypothetical protein